MGFFASRPIYVATDEGEERAVVPDWFGPPRGVLPGYAPSRAVVFRTHEAILIAGRFDVYRTGVEFTLELQLRDDDEMLDVPWERHRHRARRSGDEELPDDFMRFGVLFADGSSWSNVDAAFPSETEPPTGPLVLSRGGGGGDGSWMMNQWLWPLPPTGSLTFIAEWPKYHVDECRATVDAGQIREAATQVENLWTP